MTTRPAAPRIKSSRASMSRGKSLSTARTSARFVEGDDHTDPDQDETDAQLLQAAAGMVRRAEVAPPEPDALRANRAAFYKRTLTLISPPAEKPAREPVQDAPDASRYAVPRRRSNRG
jgi:hypothetical protein